ncbi:hypothetical protein [Cryobacterium sp. BB736]|uniref:hypothetical protein n=1 Tax=Cryobacterium sp. BB736 TaxID=2746963 RepID=UPI0018758F96|nr:hypothetical protein [Cryobacterium sp. BB736]
MSDETEPAIRVTLRDVYADVQDMKRILQDVAAKLPEHMEQTRSRLNDHEKRIRSLETRVLMAFGGFGLLTIASPFLLKVLFP